MNEKINCIKNSCINKIAKKGQKYILTQTIVQEYEYSYNDLLILKERLENNLKMCEMQRKNIDDWEKDTLVKLEEINKHLNQIQND